MDTERSGVDIEHHNHNNHLTVMFIGLRPMVPLATLASRLEKLTITKSYGIITE